MINNNIIIITLYLYICLVRFLRGGYGFSLRKP
ncbi:hypothetical protein CPL00365_CDS0060 [Klebsiella phage SmellyBerry]|uniref:Membrane protein n=2 Tax=Webervirus TaxID=1920860 RepID=A0A976MEH8_9CAUD|nr:putative membrane protein [Klebsiella phage vB_KpnS-VAC110]